jgi:uncharacterized protein HemX
VTKRQEVLVKLVGVLLALVLATQVYLILKMRNTESGLSDNEGQIQDVQSEIDSQLHELKQRIESRFADVEESVKKVERKLIYATIR